MIDSMPGKRPPDKLDAIALVSIPSPGLLCALGCVLPLENKGAKKKAPAEAGTFGIVNSGKPSFPPRHRGSIPARGLGYVDL
jgi:hypothetical protein